MDSSYKLEFQGASIVALGAFNPAIFQPYWFANNELIRTAEASAAKVDIVHPDVTSFSTEWFVLRVTTEKFAAETDDPSKYPLLKTLVVSTFAILEHTPVRAFGLNGSRHYAFPSREKLDEFGDHFAPKATWTTVLSNPKLRSQVMEGKREGTRADRVQIKLEPSARVPKGLYLHVNQHYSEMDEEKEESPAFQIERFLERLKADWEDFVTYVDTMSLHLLSHFEG